MPVQEPKLCAGNLTSLFRPACTLTAYEIVIQLLEGGTHSEVISNEIPPIKMCDSL